MPAATHLAQPNPLSNSVNGEDYTGLACFPLGQHLTSDQVSELRHTLHHLRKVKMIHQMSGEDMEFVRSSLRPLQTAKSFWSHRRDERQAKAMDEPLAAIFPDGNEDPESLEIYQFPDSRLLSSTRATAWGLFEFDDQSRKTVLYISNKTSDLSGTILHTFMTSRWCPRLQCFLAEYVLADHAKRLTGRWRLPARFQQDIDQLSMTQRKEFLERLENESKLAAPILLEKLRAYCEETTKADNEGVV